MTQTLGTSSLIKHYPMKNQEVDFPSQHLYDVIEVEGLNFEKEFSIIHPKQLPPTTTVVIIACNNGNKKETKGIPTTSAFIK